MGYVHLVADDDGGHMPHDWYEYGTYWSLEALLPTTCSLLKNELRLVPG